MIKVLTRDRLSILDSIVLMGYTMLVTDGQWLGGLAVVVLGFLVSGLLKHMTRDQ